MPDLLTLVGALYACNLMAEQAPLPYTQVQSCMLVHEAVGAKFLTENEIAILDDFSSAKRYKIKLRGYNRFKSWEKKNPDIVRKIRAEQSQRLMARANRRLSGTSF